MTRLIQQDMTYSTRQDLYNETLIRQNLYDKTCMTNMTDKTRLVRQDKNVRQSHDMTIQHDFLDMTSVLNKDLERRISNKILTKQETALCDSMITNRKM